MASLLCLHRQKLCCIGFEPLVTTLRLGFWMLIVMLLLTSKAYPQRVNQIKEHKNKINIEAVSELMSNSEPTNKGRYADAGPLKYNIKKRAELIQNIDSKIKVVDETINDYNYVVGEITRDLDAYKEEYAETIRYLSYRRNELSLLTYVFSSISFHQVFKRMLYYQQYMSYRHEQQDVLSALKITLETHIRKVQEKQAVKDKLLSDRAGEVYLLHKDVNEQKEYYNQQLGHNEFPNGKLEDNKQDGELQSTIKQYMLNNIGGDNCHETSDALFLSTTFEKSKKRLPWPISKGVMIEHFGAHNHNTMHNIRVRSSGVTFAAEAESRVRSIFPGLVSKVLKLNNGAISVIIRHGKYLSVYSNLRMTGVSTGDRVRGLQQIGTLSACSNEGEKYSELKFQIWKENEKMNPEDWLIE
ncbi:MAG: murein hydrolase activator EnvC family protein [Bacteroidales bacterium]